MAAPVLIRFQPIQKYEIATGACWKKFKEIIEDRCQAIAMLPATAFGLNLPYGL